MVRVLLFGETHRKTFRQNKNNGDLLKVALKQLMEAKQLHMILTTF